MCRRWPQPRAPEDEDGGVVLHPDQLVADVLHVAAHQMRREGDRVRRQCDGPGAVGEQPLKTGEVSEGAFVTVHRLDVGDDQPGASQRGLARRPLQCPRRGRRAVDADDDETLGSRRSHGSSWSSTEPLPPRSSVGTRSGPLVSQPGRGPSVVPQSAEGSLCCFSGEGGVVVVVR